MLNRTGRLVAAIVIMAGWLFLAIPQSAVANRALECDETPPNDCCVEVSEEICESESFCCRFVDPDRPAKPKFCGCEIVEE